MEDQDTARIPFVLIGLLARVFDDHYSRSQLTGLFMEAGASGDDPYHTSKKQMITDWLRATNDQHKAPIRVLGTLLQEFFEGSSHRDLDGKINSSRESVQAKLGENGLRYSHGGKVISTSGGLPVRSLENLLRNRDFPAVNDEFERATANVDSKPREAASAAANILEALCKEYIVQHSNLTMPSRLDLSSVFRVVRDDLGLDPASIEDEDIRRILGGLASVVDGIGSFRTHASSAHSQGTSKKMYRLSPRHARLTVGAAHTVVAFLIESWDAKSPRSV